MPIFRSDRFTLAGSSRNREALFIKLLRLFNKEQEVPLESGFNELNILLAKARLESNQSSDFVKQIRDKALMEAHDAIEGLDHVINAQARIKAMAEDK